MKGIYLETERITKGLRLRLTERGREELIGYVEGLYARDLLPGERTADPIEFTKPHAQTARHVAQ